MLRRSAWGGKLAGKQHNVQLHDAVFHNGQLAKNAIQLRLHTTLSFTHLTSQLGCGYGSCFSRSGCLGSRLLSARAAPPMTEIGLHEAIQRLSYCCLAYENM